MTARKFLMNVSLAALLLTAPGGCSTAYRTQTAQQAAATADMIREQIEATPFDLAAYSRVTAPGQPVTLYIEGDGLAWVGRHTPSLDPTPVHPVGLYLAASDDGANVIYMARPCQYSKLTTPGPCPMRYWTSARFAPEVIAAMNTAMDTLKQRHKVTGFNLVGFSGGAAVAVLLAARRDDVLSLRSVAGNLDPDEMGRIHNISPLKASLNPADVARDLTSLPQIHFIGGDDSIIPPAIFDSYKKAAGPSTCIRSRIVPGMSHGEDWKTVWPQLLHQPPQCD